MTLRLEIPKAVDLYLRGLSLSAIAEKLAGNHSRHHHLGKKNPSKGNSMRGKKHREKSKRKMSEARLRYWASRKNQ